MIYLDTSVVVPLIVPETTSPRLRSWLDRLDVRQMKELALSAWALTEVTSAMGIKVRNREIRRGQGEAARALLEDALLPKHHGCGGYTYRLSAGRNDAAGILAWPARRRGPAPGDCVKVRGATIRVLGSQAVQRCQSAAPAGGAYLKHALTSIGQSR